MIAGLKKNKALDGDKFRKWCSILEDLTRDELICIGRAYVIMKRTASKDDAANLFSNNLRAELVTGGYQGGEIDALCASVSRTGLLTPVSAFGGMAYHPTPWLEELGDLAEIEMVFKFRRA